MEGQFTLGEPIVPLSDFIREAFYGLDRLGEGELITRSAQLEIGLRTLGGVL